MPNDRDQPVIDASEADGTSPYEFHATGGAEQWRGTGSLVASAPTLLGQRMAADVTFRRLVDKGLTDLDEGRTSPL